MVMLPSVLKNPYASILWYYALSPQGKIAEIFSDNRMKTWEATWQSHKTDCDVYGKCGAFGICNAMNSPICSCLRYEPTNIEKWGRENICHLLSGNIARRTGNSSEETVKSIRIRATSSHE